MGFFGLGLLGLLSLFAFAAPVSNSPVPTLPVPAALPATCGEVRPFTPVQTPLPPGVTGRVAFYAAEYDPATWQVKRAAGLGAVNELHPVASMYKGVLVEAVMRDVDSGKLSLRQPFETTEATRSIEAYPPGLNTLQALATRAIANSDNTAADILQLAYGPERLARLVRQRSPCTRLLLTTKAMWAAQAGLLADHLGSDVLADTSRYAAQPWEAQLVQADELIAAAQRFTGPEVELMLDGWFRGLEYSPQVDLNVQPLSTAQAFTDLIARTYSGVNLGLSRPTYRQIMATGCCRPRQPRLKTRYWAAKAGSGWRILTLSGYIETPDGRRFAYTYLNDLSDVDDSELMEKQIRPLVVWIETALLELAKPEPPAAAGH